jgi:trans-2-enoyl-CoA reductase
VRGVPRLQVLSDGGSLKEKLDQNKFFAKPRLALDAVGGTSAAALADTLQDGCMLVVYGCMSGKAPLFAWQQWTFKDLTVKGFNLRSWMPANKKKARAHGRRNRDWQLTCGHLSRSR